MSKQSDGRNQFYKATDYAQMHAGFAEITEAVTGLKKQLQGAGWSEDKAEELAILMIRNGLEQNAKA